MQYFKVIKENYFTTEYPDVYKQHPGRYTFVPATGYGKFSLPKGLDFDQHTGVISGRVSRR